MKPAIRHPGPPAAERRSVLPARAQPVRLELKAGLSLNAAVARAFAAEGFASGYLQLKDARFAPLDFVIPAASPDADHAAWYSETFRLPRHARLFEAGVVVGRRDGEPFVHCHGLWLDEDGRRWMGHLLPDASILAGTTTAEGVVVSDALFEVADDPETNFRLFAPRRAGAGEGGAAFPVRAALVTIRPNEYVLPALEAVARQLAMREARIFGIGSLAGARFEEGAAVESYATEVLVRSGTIRGGRAALDIALVDMDGAIHEGRLAATRNPVCVTFELVLVETG